MEAELSLQKIQLTSWLTNSAVVFPATLQTYPQIYSFLKQHLKNTTITCFLISSFLSGQLTYLVNLSATGEKCML